MGWAELQTRQQAAVFASLGEAATWTGIADPVRVILRDEENVLGPTIVGQVTVRVRRSEVADPSEGEQVVLSDGRVFEVIAEPLLDRKQVWQCEAAPVAAA